VAPANCAGISTPQIDHAGHLWFANAWCGILEFTPDTGTWQRHQLPLNTGGYQISVGADGFVFAFGSKEYLLAYSSDTESWKELAQLDAKLPYRASLAVDHHGGVWLSVCEFHTIQHYNHSAVQTIAPPNPSAGCLNVFADRQERLWGSTYDELFLYDGASWQLIPSLSLGQIKALTVAPDGRLWFVGDWGIAVYAPTKDNRP
jgi:streptogramin lyase